MKKINAFIPAAGYGERLRPITDHIPKPLLPILGKPVIESVIDKIASLPLHKICINTHHKAMQIQDWADNSVHSGLIQLFHEQELLGTGGALKNAEDILKDAAFIVHNADIITDADICLLMKKHLGSGNIATLAVHDFERFNNVWIDSNGSVKQVGSKDHLSGLCKIAFMGIAVYSPDFLQFLPEGRSSVVDAWLKATASGNLIGTVDYTGSTWTDIGTPDAYAEAVFAALRNEGESIYLHSSLDCRGLDLGANTVIESNVILEGHAYVENSIVLPGSRISLNAIIERRIEGPGFSVSYNRRPYAGKTIPESDLITGYVGKQDMAEIECIGTGGSDRIYYRIRGLNRAFVLMKCSLKDQDYERHMALTTFFRNYRMPVPELLIADDRTREALFEDLGDMTLYSWLKCRRAPDQVEEVYRKVLDMLVDLHTLATSCSVECPVLGERIFDYDHLRWETNYFLERFIRGLRRDEVRDEAGLDRDFERLARTADRFRKTIIHRDFQCQNIMMSKGDSPRLIDFQGSRIGPPAYDLASMLWDPYYRIDDDMRQRLLEHYIRQRKNAQSEFDDNELMRSILPCRLQRHMQALGAYSFLSLIKGRQYFLKHVPQALKYLKEEAEAAKDEYPALFALISGIT